MRPSSASPSATMAATSSERDTSVRFATARPPAATISATTRCRASAFTSAASTLAPSAAKRFAMASPNPDPAPVTTTVRSSNRCANVMRLPWLPRSSVRAGSYSIR